MICQSRFIRPILWVLATVVSLPSHAGIGQQSRIGELIDRLVRSGEEGTGVGSLANFDQFLAIDEEPEFGGGLLGVAPPDVDPTMREIVRLGMKALPQLLAHLQDSRETRITIRHLGGIGSMWFSSEYYGRVRDLRDYPIRDREWWQSHKDVPNHTYTVRVGDLCHVAVGQIVNRSLLAVRHQPTNCIVVNSPVERPSLAELVRSDWSGLTAQEHERSLVNDMEHRPDGALKRLLFYYPQTGWRFALDRLSRPLKDNAAIEKLMDRVREVSTRSELADLREEGLNRHATDVAQIEWNLLGNDLRGAATDAEEARTRDRIQALFRGVAPPPDARARSLIYFAFGSLAQSLVCFGDRTLDSPCLAMFRRVRKGLGQAADRQHTIETMAMALADRLLRSGQALGLREYAEALQERIRVHEAKGETPETNAWLGKLQTLVSRIPKGL